MTNIPHIEGVLSADEVVRTAESIAALQLDSGMIPWFEGGHCDPWNHVETAMALDVAGLHREAERAYVAGVLARSRVNHAAALRTPAP